MKLKLKLGLRIKIIIAIALSIIISMIICTIIRESYISSSLKPSYYNSTNILEHVCLDFRNKIYNLKSAEDITEYKYKSNEFSHKYKEYNLKVFITNTTGEILYKSSNAVENRIDIYDLFSKDYNLKYNRLINRPYADNIVYDNNDYFNTYHDYFNFFPLKIKDNNLFVIITAVPTLSPGYYNNRIGFLYVLLFIAIFILSYYLLTNTKIKYIKDLCLGISEMATGNLHFRVKEKGNDELHFLANKINFMASEIENKIEREKKLEDSKNELIVNVAHDIRTPLTTIMGYLTIIKDKGFKNEEELLNYADTALKKSQRLKKLMDDLFTYTKLSSNNILLDFNDICLNDLLDQLIDEFIPIFEKNNLTLEDNLPKKIIMIHADVDKLVRVFENLFSNAIKYSLRPSKVFLHVTKEQNYVVISLSNLCDNLANEDIEKIFERFYMADKSRSLGENSSGLGLAITKSIIELHNGNIDAEFENNLITFKIKIPTKAHENK